MIFFAHDDDVAQMLAHAAAEPQDLRNLLALCWQLRQRDWRRALSLADEIPAQLTAQSSSLPIVFLPLATQMMDLRLQLVRGEVLWLQSQFQAGQALASAVLSAINALPEDNVECAYLRADVHWLLGSLENEMGQFAARDQHWQEMRQAALQLDDQLRLGFVDAAIASTISFRSTLEAEHLAKRYLESDLQQWPLATRAAIYDFLGLQVRMGSDLSRAVVYWTQAFAAYQQTGQLRRTIHTASNIGNWFCKLNDANTALEWTELALQLARPLNWPHALAVCLLHSTNSLRQLGKVDAAQAILQEALEIFQDLPISRAYAISLWTLGDMALARDDNSRALQAFTELQTCANTLGHGDFQTNALRGQAQALCNLARYAEGLAVAQAGLQLATEQEDVKGKIAALQIIASIYDKCADCSEFAILLPNGQPAPSTPLHYLLQALALGEAIENFIIPSELFEAIGEAYAKIDDFALAYRHSRLANLARESIYNNNATNRANALQAQHQVQRERAEREHLQQLALAEAGRAKVLQNTSSTLAHLGAIGQEITAQLDLQAVCHSIFRHVHSLLDTSYFVIYLFTDDQRRLHSIYRVQEEQHLPPIEVLLDDAACNVARCAREQHEVLINDCTTPQGLALQTDVVPTHSGMFGPLSTSKGKLGVMTIQTTHRQAYGEREELIFRNLCAYGAIALDNAFAYKKLQETQQQLVEQEKLAALGSLVAGVAHELNTPLGNSLITATGLQDYADELEKLVVGKRLKLSELMAYIAKHREGMGLIVRGLQTAANLVVSFKQVAADRSTAQRRCFDLRQTTREVVATMMSQVRASGHRLQLEIEAGIVMDSYPGPYGQVITSFIENAITHAFIGREHGLIQIHAHIHKKGRVLVKFTDNGVGIAAKDMKRIFEPFFTTNLGQGGNGLGLSISYNIVTSMLQGQISADSKATLGAVFYLDLPLAVSS